MVETGRLGTSLLPYSHSFISTRTRCDFVRQQPRHSYLRLICDGLSCRKVYKFTRVRPSSPHDAVHRIYMMLRSKNSGLHKIVHFLLNFTFGKFENSFSPRMILVLPQLQSPMVASQSSAEYEWGDWVKGVLPTPFFYFSRKFKCCWNEKRSTDRQMEIKSIVYSSIIIGLCCPMCKRTHPESVESFK